MTFETLMDNTTFNTKVCVHRLDDKSTFTFICNMAGEYPNKDIIATYRVDSISVVDNVLYVEIEPIN